MGPERPYSQGEVIHIFDRLNATLHTAHCTLHTAHCTLHTAHCTLHTAHGTRHTAHCTLHTAYCTLHCTALHCTALHCTLADKEPDMSHQIAGYELTAARVAGSNISSPFWQFLAISSHLKAIFSHFNTFPSMSGHFQPCPVISSYF